MKDIDEIEGELADAYQALDHRELRLWNLDALKTRKEELHREMDLLARQWGTLADNSVGILLCEYYDVEDEIEVREYEPDPELLKEMDDWTGPRYTKHTNLSA